MVELKCKNCAYEHSVGPQFFKGTNEHKCPGCGVTGQVVMVIREGGKLFESAGQSVENPEISPPLKEFELEKVELVPLQDPPIKGAFKVESLGEVTPEAESNTTEEVDSEQTNREEEAQPKRPKPKSKR